MADKRFRTVELDGTIGELSVAKGGAGVILLAGRVASFGERLAERRRGLGMTQEELAAASGLSVRSIQNFESGRISRPRASTLRLLAAALRLPDGDLHRFMEDPATGLGLGRAGDPATGLGAARESHREAVAEASPRRLPLATAGFAGREAALARLDQLLASVGEGPAAPVVISAVSGTAGIGKTALAVHWARRVSSRFTDGHLYVDLRGFDAGAELDPAEAVRCFLGALGAPGDRIPASLDAQIAMYRTLLAGRRMLILLDNARDAAQVRPLLPGAAGCFVLVTSRNRLAGLVAAEGAYPLTLDLLPATEAGELLATRIGDRRVAAEPAAVTALVELCAGLPLALAIVAARAAANPEQPLATLVEQLKAAGGGLDAFTGGGSLRDIRAVFSWSYRALSDRAARLFRLLGLYDGPDCSAAAMASLAGSPLPAVREALLELVNAHLLTEQHPWRYGFHDLLREYAGELVRALESAEDRRAARVRLYDHQLRTAFSAAVLLQPQWDPIPLEPPVAGALPERIVDRRGALVWFSVERQSLLASVRGAAAHGWTGYAWRLAWTLAAYFAPRGYWTELLASQRVAVAAARRSQDRTGEAVASRFLARAGTRLGQYDEAEDLLQTALRLYGELGDRAGQAQAHHNLADLFVTRGQYAQALRHAYSGLALTRAAGGLVWQGRALNAVGWCHALLGEYLPALAHCEQALAVQVALGDTNGQAATWDSLGYINHQLGQVERAISCYQRSVGLFEETADRYHEAEALTRLGAAHRSIGDLAAAGGAWRRALELFQGIGDPEAEQVQARLREIPDGVR